MNNVNNKPYATPKWNKNIVAKMYRGYPILKSHTKKCKTKRQIEYVRFKLGSSRFPIVTNQLKTASPLNLVNCNLADCG